MPRPVRSFSGYHLSLLLWVVLLVFFFLVFSFPKWITFFYPLPHRELVLTYAERYKVDPYLVFAVIKAESEFKLEAESARGARGLMQIMPATARWIAGQMKMKDFREEDLLKPELNIEMGCWYLANLNQEFKGHLPLVVAAYNAGRGNVREWLLSGTWNGHQDNIADIPFPETRKYVKVVLTDYEIYRVIYSRP